MFTGFITGVVVYFAIGVGHAVSKDDTGTVKSSLKKLFNESYIWPKDVYNKFKKD